MTQQPRQRQPLALLDIAQAWRRGDLYARLWLEVGGLSLRPV